MDQFSSIPRTSVLKIFWISIVRKTRAKDFDIPKNRTVPEVEVLKTVVDRSFSKTNKTFYTHST